MKYIQFDIWNNVSIFINDNIKVEQIYMGSELLLYKDNAGTHWDTKWGDYPGTPYTVIILDSESSHHKKGETEIREIDGTIEISPNPFKVLINEMSNKVTEEIDREIMIQMAEMYRLRLLATWTVGIPKKYEGEG
jgi:hypothetical protein